MEFQIDHFGHAFSMKNLGNGSRAKYDGNTGEVWAIKRVPSGSSGYIGTFFKWGNKLSKFCDSWGTGVG